VTSKMPNEYFDDAILKRDLDRPVQFLRHCVWERRAGIQTWRVPAVRLVVVRSLPDSEKQLNNVTSGAGNQGTESLLRPPELPMPDR
jgi:hypothetical protein